MQRFNQTFAGNLKKVKNHHTGILNKMGGGYYTDGETLDKGSAGQNKKRKFK
jgi:hypothetical protein